MAAIAARIYPKTLLSSFRSLSTAFILDNASASRIKSSIRSESNPDRLVELFKSASMTPVFYGDRVIYKVTVQKLARASRPDLIELLLEDQITNPSTPKSEGFLMRIIFLYGEASMPNHAASAFDRITACRSDRSLCALLSAFLKSGDHDRVRETFRSAESALGVVPGVASFNLHLKSLCEAGEVAAARKMLDEMPQRGVLPDAISYNTILNGYLKGSDEGAFDEFLKEMSSKKMDANVPTFNCRIALLCRQGRSFMAEELLDLMISKNLRPDLISFSVLINGFCREGNAESAMRVFRRMRAAKNEAGSVKTVNRTAYTALIGCLVKNGDFDSGLEVCSLCLGKKWAPSVEDVKALVHELIEKSRVDEAKNVVSMMRGAVKGDSIEAWKSAEGEFAM